MRPGALLGSVVELRRAASCGIVENGQLWPRWIEQGRRGVLERS